ncbi:ice-binding family protein [Mucilaginibacter sp. UR6-11]|uniref:InlB B-repeat-containing protein n=1 Tax=Mucilaginibacter sp. UR6-11 TaxID=1435644 RepID=UPI001E333F17|nr:ice-binding family protein [Mucilaginibacter sp. UR6-11]MCC8426433.1 ice-binding family protein [Mucilaginibacter sp. UR6-11]
MKEKITTPTDRIQMLFSKWHPKKLKSAWLLPLLLITLALGCKKDNFVPVEGVCPLVVSDPMDKAVDVVLTKVITATFNTPMDAATITSSTFIVKQGATAISGTVAPTTNPAVFTFTPAVPLLPFTVYNATITKGAADKFHTALTSNYDWSFTTIPQVTVASNPVAGGVTTGGGTFAQGAAVAVTATPNAGYIFANWTENGTVVSTSSSYPFKMAGNRALVANYSVVVPGQFAVVLSSNPIVGGTTTGGGSFNAGTNVTVTATPTAGYTFVNWTVGGVVVSTSPGYTFLLVADKTLVANFAIIPASQFALVLSSNPAAGGSTTGSGPYAAGTSVTATATTNPGYTFVDWKENGLTVSTSPAYTFPLNGNRTLVANFTQNVYTLNVTAVNGTVAKNPNQATYNSGSTVVLTATPNAGFTFSSWSGDAAGGANPLTVVMNSNKNITANFIAIPSVAPLFSSIFGAFGGSAGVTNQGINTVINNGSIGTTAVSTAVTGFHDGLTNDVYTETPLNVGLVTGGIYSAPPFPGTAPKFAIATQALAAANAFYISISPANRPGGTDPGAGELGGLTLAPGTYKSAAGTFKITNGNLTLDAQGDPNAVWVFQAPTSLTVGIAGPTGARSIILKNGAQAQNVYWYVGSSATINGAGGGVMVGTIIASAGVTFSTAGNVVQTVLNGRAISLVASVTMVNTTINTP